MSLEGRFAAGYPFALDPFQVRADAALAGGRSVLVCAPTGAGKTVVGEFGVHLALERGGKAFYTTPLKALSNQKFGDFIARHGAPRVGLLTGDNSINGEAPVVVMTTEVLRNMLYESSPTLSGLQIVVLDEVHYLKDPYRGATWEEILIHLPEDVQVAALSATLSNAEEFGDWLRSVRGETEVVIEEHRPVPIEHVCLTGDRLEPMFVSDGGKRRPNPALRRAREHADRRRGRRGSPRRRPARPDRVEVVERLQAEGLLPAIVFIFSRAGCEGAVSACRAARVRLTTDDERERIREYVELRATSLPDADLDALGYEAWLDGLERGVAAHHAGMIPLFKETVEELFERALVKVVFATETLALGVNMPAKTVVLERLIKFTGEQHELMTPGDYTQLTGRAGRRGMDAVGYGVTLHQPDVPFDRVVGLAEGRDFPLVSSFRPSYNMAVNLLRRHSVEEATRLLTLSFGQFLADRSVVRQQRLIERNERALAGYREHVVCERGDFEEYWKRARAARATEREEAEGLRRDRAAGVREALAALRPGEVVRLRRGARAATATVIEVRHGKRGEPRALVLTSERKLTRLAPRDLREPPAVVGEVRLPRGDPRAASYRDAVAAALEQMAPSEPRPPVPRSRSKEARETERALRAHPVHDCPDREEHERWMVRVDALETETGSLRRRVRARTGTLARTFERVLAVLEAFGYVEEGRVTDKGERLARIYNESDLLVAEALETGILDALAPADLAAVVSSLVYESRPGSPEGDVPTEPARRAHAALLRLHRRIEHAEHDNRLALVREPDPGFAWLAHRWAGGASLEEILDEQMPAGDFVRSTKQLYDLLRQSSDAAVSAELSDRCREAARAVYRGVVASSGVL